jgi:hypothetical protein
VDANQISFPNGNVDYTKVHDQVVAIDPVNMTVTLNLINGFSFGRPVWYLSMDTSSTLGAAIEHNTFAPLMQKILLGHDDSFASPVERIFISTNGPESGGCNNPLRQGLSADLADGFRPNNVVGGIPTIALDYSPYWDAQLFEWTQDAIDQGFRGQLREEFQILTFVQDGLITGPAGKNLRELRFLDQLSYRPAPRLRVGWLTTERPAISHFDMAGLFIPYLCRNIPPPHDWYRWHAKRRLIARHDLHNGPLCSR